MALDLDTSSKGEDLKAESKRQKKLILMGIEGVIGLSAAILVLGTVITTSATTDKINQASVEYETYKAEFEAYKQEHPLVNVDNNEGSENKEPDKHIIEKQMASAKNAGAEVVLLQNQYFKDGFLNDEDTKRLVALTGSSELWFGADVDPLKVGIEWKLITPYDTTEDRYNVLFGCYTADGKYLLSVRQATYYAPKTDDPTAIGSFTISPTKHITDYGKAILNGQTSVGNESSSVTDDITDIKDQLIQNGVIETPSEEDYQTPGASNVSDNDTSNVSDNNVSNGSDNNPGNTQSNDSDRGTGSVVDPDDLGNEF